MATLTIPFFLQSTPDLPAGTLFYVYEAKNRVLGQAPSGDAVAGPFTMQPAGYTVSGLDPGAAYVAYAVVGGQHRYIAFVTTPINLTDTFAGLLDVDLASLDSGDELAYEAPSEAWPLGRIYGRTPAGTSSTSFGIDVTQAPYSALPGLPDCLAGILAAKVDGDAQGRPCYFPGGTSKYNVSGEVEWSGLSYPFGDGYQQTVIVFGNTTRGFSIGAWRSTSFGNGGKGLRGRRIGGFSCWGGSGAGSELCTNPLTINTAVQTSFSDMEVMYAKGDGIIVEQSQNCGFQNVNAEANLGCGIRFDRGTGGHGLFRCEFTNNGLPNVLLTESIHRSGIYQRPTDIHFFACIIERTRNMPAEHTASVFIAAGERITFTACNMVGTSGNYDGCVMELDGGAWDSLSTVVTVALTDCWLYGSNTASEPTPVAMDGIRIHGNASLTLGGTCKFQNPGDGGPDGTGGAIFAYDGFGGAQIHLHGRIDSSYTNTWSNLPLQTYLSGAQALNGATITVTDTSNFPTAGSLYVPGSGTITYTGKTATTFTGCSGGTASTIASATRVVGFVAQVNGAATLPAATTINVDSSTGLAATGTLKAIVGNAGGRFAYTGKTGTSVTGVTGTAGTLADNAILAAEGTGSPDTVIRTRSNYPLQITRPSEGDNGFMLGVDGESGMRMLLKGSGIFLGDGSSNSTSSGFLQIKLYDLARGIVSVGGGIRLSSGTLGQLSLVRQSAVPANPPAGDAQVFTLLDGVTSRLVFLDELGSVVTVASGNTDTGWAALTPTASPWTYHNTRKTRQSLILRGGTVSQVAYSRDNIAFEDVGVVAGKLEVEPGDYVKVTYTVVPTALAMSRVG